MSADSRIYHGLELLSEWKSMLGVFIAVTWDARDGFSANASRPSSRLTRAERSA
jgi:hypothetical protein